MSKQLKLSKQLTFKSIYTSKQETYAIQLENIEAITDVLCPIDKTRLIQQETLFDPLYICKNCGHIYLDWHEDYLKFEKKKIIASAKDKLTENSKLLRILEAVGEKYD